MMQTSNGGENEKLKRVEFHLTSGAVIAVRMTDEKIMLARMALVDVNRTIQAERGDGSLSIPSRNVVMMEVLPAVSDPIPPPVAPQSRPAMSQDEIEAFLAGDDVPPDPDPGRDK